MREWLQFNKFKMSVKDALIKLNDLVDESDPDTSLPNIIHAFQTAESIREKHPDLDWFHLTGLIHDLGKVSPVSPTGMHFSFPTPHPSPSMGIDLQLVAIVGAPCKSVSSNPSSLCASSYLALKRNPIYRISVRLPFVVIWMTDCHFRATGDGVLRGTPMGRGR